MAVSNIVTQVYRVLAPHHSDRGSDIHTWPLMPRLGWYLSMVTVGVMPGILAYAVITPRSVSGWLVTAASIVLGSLIWFDNGRLKFPALARAALYALIYSWFLLAFVILIWPISVDDLVSIAVGIAVVVIIGLVASGIPSWMWRGSDPPFWVVKTNGVLRRPINNRIRLVWGSTVGEVLVLCLLVVGWLTLMLF